MENTMRVCAVVVTYNRCVWLIECLHTLLAQSRALEQQVMLRWKYFVQSEDDAFVKLEVDLEVFDFEKGVVSQGGRLST